MNISLGNSKFDSDTIRAIAECRWHIDCPVMKLVQHGDHATTPNYLGSGYITQNESGQLEIKLYCSQHGPAMFDQEISRFAEVPAGVLIPDSHYYDL